MNKFKTSKLMMAVVAMGALLVALLGAVMGPLAAQDDAEPDPRQLLETALSQVNAAADVEGAFTATYSNTERVYIDDVFRERRVSQREDGTAHFVRDEEGGAFEASMMIRYEQATNTSSASTVASYEAEWDARLINGVIYSQGAYLSGGGDFTSIETGWRIIVTPSRYPLRSVVLDLHAMRRDGQPTLGLPILLDALDNATEITFLPNNDDLTITTMRLTYTGEDAAYLLSLMIADGSESLTSNPILTALVDNIRTDPTNTTLLVETLQFDAEGYLIRRDSTFNVVATALPIGAILTDADPNLTMDYNQTIVREHTYTYNTGLVRPEVPDLAITPVPFEDTFVE